jgi:hypothetical protein
MKTIDIVHEGSQWMLFVASVVKGPLQALVNTNTVHKGLCLLPFDNLQIVSIHVDYVEVRN